MHKLEEKSKLISYYYLRKRKRFYKGKFTWQDEKENKEWNRKFKWWTWI